jgi:uncharacterized protein (DUF983 family)
VPVDERTAIMRTILRGLRTRCPRCGRGPLFAGRYRLRERCAQCGLAFGPYAADTWAMIYFSTAGLTGVVVVGLILARPANLMLGRVALGAVALALIVASLPFRKGAAIALNWLIAARAGPESDGVSSDPHDC